MQPFLLQSGLIALVFGASDTPAVEPFVGSVQLEETLAAPPVFFERVTVVENEVRSFPAIDGGKQRTSILFAEMEVDARFVFQKTFSRWVNQAASFSSMSATRLNPIQIPREAGLGAEREKANSQR